jgi:hypothetical protein
MADALVIPILTATSDQSLSESPRPVNCVRDCGDSRGHHSHAVVLCQFSSGENRCDDPDLHVCDPREWFAGFKHPSSTDGLEVFLVVCGAGGSALGLARLADLAWAAPKPTPSSAQMSVIAWFRKLSANSKRRGRTFSSYCTSRTPLWLPSGWECRGRRLSTGRPEYFPVEVVRELVTRLSSRGSQFVVANLLPLISSLNRCRTLSTLVL